MRFKPSSHFGRPRPNPVQVWRSRTSLSPSLDVQSKVLICCPRPGSFSCPRPFSRPYGRLVQTKSRFESGFSLDKIHFNFSEFSRLNPDYFLDQIQIWIRSGHFWKIKINFVQTESRLKSVFCLDQTFSRKKSRQANQIIWTTFAHRWSVVNSILIQL